jgi:hypothetical protein
VLDGERLACEVLGERLRVDLQQAGQDALLVRLCI